MTYPKLKYTHITGCNGGQRTDCMLASNYEMTKNLKYIPYFDLKVNRGSILTTIRNIGSVRSGRKWGGVFEQES